MAGPCCLGPAPGWLPVVIEHSSNPQRPHPCVCADSAPSWLESELLGMEQCPVLRRAFGCTLPVHTDQIRIRTRVSASCRDTSGCGIDPALPLISYITWLEV